MGFEWLSMLLFRRAKSQLRSDVEATVPVELSQTTVSDEWLNWPIPIVPALNRSKITDPEILKLITNSDERLDIKVGKGRSAKRWKIHKALLCCHSEFFKRAADSSFREGLNGRFDLSEHDPTAFSLFVTWLYQAYESSFDSSIQSWKREAEKCYVLGEMLVAPAFQAIAFEIFVRYSKDVSKTKLRYIEDEAPPGSSLQLFATALKAWRLESRQHRESKPHLDPQQFAVEHWSMWCGREGNTLCVHIPWRLRKRVTAPSTPISSTGWFRHLACYGNLCALVAALITTIVFNSVLLWHFGRGSPIFNFGLFAEIFALLATAYTIYGVLQGRKYPEPFLHWLILSLLAGSLLFGATLAIAVVACYCPQDYDKLYHVTSEQRLAAIADGVQDWPKYDSVCQSQSRLFVNILAGSLGGCFFLVVSYGCMLINLEK